LAVSVGVNVAVTVADPASPKSSCQPAIDTTESALEMYAHVPVADVVAIVGAEIFAFASPYVAVTFDHVNVGVARATVRIADVDADSKFAVDVGVKVAVITDVPPPTTVKVDPATVATAVVAEPYDHAPATADPPNVAVGLLKLKSASPNVLVGMLNAPSTGVALSTVTVIVTVPPET
jgi:hypothetical protein